MVKLRLFGRKKNLETSQALKPTKQRLRDRIASFFKEKKPLDEETLEELEEVLLAADLGWELTEKTLSKLKESYGHDLVESREQLLNRLIRILSELTPEIHSEPIRNEEGLTVTLIVGVNGSGKTTSIAKLAAAWKSEGREVMIAAGDTFRAAASEQLTTWSDRLNVDLVRHREGADPSAVVYDALQAAQARGIDDLIIDTAGRLHTDSNLMKELEKIRRIIQKQIPDAPHETLLVLDATGGQNSLNQAKMFCESVPLTGIVMAKLDGTARGGIILAITREIKVPIKYLGTGEQPENLEYFQIDDFIESLVS